MFGPQEKLKTQAQVNYKKTDGILYLTNRRIGFSQNQQTITTTLQFSTIKGQQINKAGSSKTLLKIACIDKLNDNAEVAHTFAFTSNNAIKEREKFKDAIMVIIEKFGVKNETARPGNQQKQEEISFSEKFLSINKTPISKAEQKIRQIILSKNKNMAQIHKEVVLSGLISEEEFWENRQHLLKVTEAEQTQNRGPPSGYVDVKPVTSSDGSEIKYTLTPQIIEELFQQYPQLLEAYEENVPDKLTEEEFWKRYFKSKYFYMNRNMKNDQNATEDKVFDDLLDREKTDIEATISNNEYNKVRNVVDLDANESNYEKHSNLNDYTMKHETKETTATSLIRQFNYHSSKILKNIKDNQSEKNNSVEEHDVDLYDLKKHKQNKALPLTIKDDTKYHSNAETQDSDNNNQHKIGETAQLIQSFVRKEAFLIIKDSLPKSEEFHEEMKQLQTITKRKKTTINQEFIKETPLLEKLVTLNINSVELLRHFWACVNKIEASNNQENIQTLHQKAERMINALKNIETKIKKVNNTFSETQRSKLVMASHILDSILKSIEKSYSVFEKLKS